MYKWFTLQSPSVETLYGLCQENMNTERKGGRGWNTAMLSVGWQGDSTLEKGHPPLPGPVPKPGAGHEKLRVGFRDSLSHHLGAKRNRITEFRSGRVAERAAQPKLKVMVSGLFSPLLVRGSWDPCLSAGVHPSPPSARPHRALSSVALDPSWPLQMPFPCWVRVY